MVQKLFEKWFKDKICLTVITFFLGMLVYYQFYTGILSNPDGVQHWDNIDSGSWVLAYGRWARQCVDYIKPVIHISPITSFFVIFFFSLAGVLLADLFKLTNKFYSVLISCCIVCFPMVAEIITYHFCSYAYALAFLLAILSIIAVVKIKNKLIGIVVGSLLLAFSLGCYQSNLSVAATVGLMYLILILCEMPDKLKDWFDTAKQILFMGIAGTLIYYIILKILLQINNINMTSYKGADKINLFYIVKNLFSTFKNAYIDFIDFFFSSNIMVNSYLTKSIYICAFVLLFITLCFIILRIRKYPLAVLLLVSSFLLLPLFCNIIDIATPDTRVSLLTSGGVCLFIPFVIILFFYELNHYNLKRCITLFKTIGCFLILSVIWNYILIDTTDAALMQLNKDWSVSLANRIYTQVEMADGYNGESKLIVIGAPDFGKSFSALDYYKKTNKYARYGMLWTDGYGSYYCWMMIFHHYVSRNIKWYSPEYINNIIESKQFEDMPVYPQKGSINRIYDFWVVKISDI